MNIPDGDAHPRITPFFLDRQDTRLFCVWIQPPKHVPETSALLHCAAFGEEMNKSRVMVSSLARRVSMNGMSTLILDLHGTGDSDGDMRSANWQTWSDDIDAAMAWIGQQGIERIALWGIRLGALLAVEAAGRHTSRAEDLVLWQPVLNGQRFLKQFLRLRTASELLSDPAPDTLPDLDEELAANGYVEIAGYPIAGHWLESLAAIHANRDRPAANRVGWFEVSGLSPPRLSPASQAVIAAWRNAGVHVYESAVAGEPYWGTTEISFCEDLVASTARYLGNA